jgi:hypothetical protein
VREALVLPPSTQARKPGGVRPPCAANEDRRPDGEEAAGRAKAPARPGAAGEAAARRLLGKPPPQHVRNEEGPRPAGTPGF